jgi:hypothetical protein
MAPTGQDDTWQCSNAHSVAKFRLFCTLLRNLQLLISSFSDWINLCLFPWWRSIWHNIGRNAGSVHLFHYRNFVNADFVSASDWKVHSATAAASVPRTRKCWWAVDNSVSLVSVAHWSLPCLEIFLLLIISRQFLLSDVHYRNMILVSGV